MPDLKYLEYLRKLDRIIIPEEFTYFVHNTQFGKNEKKSDRMWEKIPTDSFTINKEMSFVERDARVREAFDYGGVKSASTFYRVNPRGKNFQIRILIPKQHLSKEKQAELGITPEEQELLDKEYRGLGDNRHPKLKNGEKIYIFASSTVDEISGKKIDILYGIREQDIERYAKLVHKLLKDPHLPYFYLSDQTKHYKFGDSEESRDAALLDFSQKTSKPYALTRDRSLARYKEQIIVGLDGKIQGTALSQFETEYLNEQEKRKKQENGKNQNRNGENER